MFRTRNIGLLGAAAALAAMSAVHPADAVEIGGPSRSERDAAKARREAKAARETWDIPEGESRQVRRARERAHAKRYGPGQ